MHCQIIPARAISAHAGIACPRIILLLQAIHGIGFASDCTASEPFRKSALDLHPLEFYSFQIDYGACLSVRSHLKARNVIIDGEAT